MKMTAAFIIQVHRYVYLRERYGSELNTTTVKVFHEGLKSWSCCNTVNKPVLEFDEFMKIPGCIRGPHSAEVAAPEPAPSTSSRKENVKLTRTEDGKESYSSLPAAAATAKMPVQAVPRPAAPPPPPAEEEDDLDAPVAPGTKCRHSGCNTLYVSDEENRKGDGLGTMCTYHPGKPIFHEGSKGYLCCKRRVLEFDEFLKIEGCKQGRHVFVPKSKGDLVCRPVILRSEIVADVHVKAAEELTTCRIDHYQTPNAVHVTVFAKQADQQRSSVVFEENQVHLDVVLPGAKRFKRSLDLFGPIVASTSTFKYYGTKIELNLKKLDGRSWTLLERTDRDLGNISLTFGVGGRTGTIGAKELVLDGENNIKRLA
ncbi:hypothetical protein EWM64_g3294 [Hericium alpestre]|uniref:CS domain-containing protein n=1 Tax=Hericium alpestre TaxID=135208 RepID=A0A4Z0A4W1_9AGAM|nr:hypothetical protein EWM64_g3294 [Hericium alpestre]